MTPTASGSGASQAFNFQDQESGFCTSHGTNLANSDNRQEIRREENRSFEEISLGSAATLRVTPDIVQYMSYDPDSQKTYRTTTEASAHQQQQYFITSYPNQQTATVTSQDPNQNTRLVSQSQATSNLSSQQAYRQQQDMMAAHQPPEFVQKIQPCRVLDGEEAYFECSYRGEPSPTVTWYRDSTIIKPSSSYLISTDPVRGHSRLTIRGVSLGSSDAVFTVKIENVSGSAKSSANLVVSSRSSAMGLHDVAGLRVDSSDGYRSSSMSREAGGIHLTASGTSGWQSSSLGTGAGSANWQLAPGSGSGIASWQSSPTSSRAAGWQSSSTLDAGGGGSNPSVSIHLIDNCHSPQPVVRQLKIPGQSSPYDQQSISRISPDSRLSPSYLHTVHDIQNKPSGELVRVDARVLCSSPTETGWSADQQHHHHSIQQVTTCTSDQTRPGSGTRIVLEGDLSALLIVDCGSNCTGQCRCAMTDSRNETIDYSAMDNFRRINQQQQEQPKNRLVNSDDRRLNQQTEQRDETTTTTTKYTSNRQFIEREDSDFWEFKRRAESRSPSYQNQLASQQPKQPNSQPKTDPNPNQPTHHNPNTKSEIQQKVTAATTKPADQQQESPATTRDGNQKTEPSWLAYRVPDMDSVYSDPLYSDFMMELQRLEDSERQMRERMSINDELEPVEVFQRPVFVQSITPEHIETEETGKAEFVCRIVPASDPNMRVEWTVNGRPLIDSSRYTCEFDFGVARLKINRCESEDSGVYQCKASNSAGESISSASLRVNAKNRVQYETLNPAGLDKIRELENPKAVDQVEEQPVEQAPKFLSHILDYVEKEEGESVHFECCLSPVDDPDLKTEWFFNGRPLVTGSRFHTIDDFGFIVLDIDWLFPRDTGEYVCRATNKHGTDMTRTVLRVKPAKNIILESQLDNPEIIDKLRQLEFPDVEQEVVVEEPDKPARFVQPLRSEANKSHFVEGDNVHFEARVGPATDGNLTVEWFHNDKPLISGHRFKPSFDFGHIQLDILYVYAEDSGVYKCVAHNATGRDESSFEIRVQGKPSLVYQSQLPKEMVGGVQKITEMEAMWNKPPEPEEDEAPAERQPPEFVLKLKPCVAFEGSCARFCCRVLGNPRPRVIWTLNGQTVVSGSRHKLTYDGMHHLTIPKCLMSDAGKLEVHAKNPLGECYCATQLKVRRKVDDYRGVLKNSPNPWYDEQSLKVYQRRRSNDLTDDDEADYYTFQAQRHFQLQQAAEQQSSSPMANQLVGYMEPDTPDVNLLAQSHSPLVAPGDLHPVVAERQVVMAPAPSTIKRALDDKSNIRTPEKSFQLPEADQRRYRQRQEQSQKYQALVQTQQEQLQQQQQQQQQQLEQHYQSMRQQQYQDSNVQQYQLQQQQQQRSKSPATQQSGNHNAPSDLSGQQQKAHVFGLQRPAKTKASSANEQYLSALNENYARNLRQQQQQQEQEMVRKQQMEAELSAASSSSSQQQQQFDSRLPPPSPESKVHGKEVHQHTHKQLQKERRANKEIVREIIEKEIFEQEHKGVTKENRVRGSSVERGSTPDSVHSNNSDLRRLEINQMLYQQQQQQQYLQNQRQHQSRQGQAYEGQQFNQSQQLLSLDQQQNDETMVLLDSSMVPPEFVHKIQPCRAIDGDQASFECTFIGEPKPTITWFRDGKLIKPSNLHSISTDAEQGSSKLTIRRVALNANAVYTVKAENVAGSAKSSANLVVEPHPLPGAMGQQVGVGQHVDSGEWQTSMMGADLSRGRAADSGLVTTTTTNTSTTMDSDQQVDEQNGHQKIISVRTRKLSAEQMANLIRASPEGLIAPNFLHTLHDIHSKLGELIRLDARLLGSQPMDVRWLKDGERVRADKSHKMVLEGDLYTLLILECSARDEGLYSCVATNRVGEARCEANVIISDGRPSSSMSAGARTPDIVTSHTYSSTGAGSSMTGQHMTSSSHATASQMTSSYSQSSSSSSAQYMTMQQSEQQQASSLASSSSTTAAGMRLASGQQSGIQPPKQHYGMQKHHYNPLMNQFTTNSERSLQQECPKLIKKLENQQVREGKSVVLRCQISSFPIAEVSWFKGDDKQIKPSKYFRIYKDNDETYCLKILETFPEDQGEYKCVARAANGVNQVVTKATITVIPNSPK